LAVGTRVAVAAIFLSGAIVFFRGARGGVVLHGDVLVVRSPVRTRQLRRDEIANFEVSRRGEVVAHLVRGGQATLWGIAPGFGAGRDESRVTASLSELRAWLLAR
jgi:hypothetical protein